MLRLTCTRVLVLYLLLHVLIYSFLSHLFTCPGLPFVTQCHVSPANASHLFTLLHTYSFLFTLFSGIYLFMRFGLSFVTQCYVSPVNVSVTYLLFFTLLYFYSFLFTLSSLTYLRVLGCHSGLDVMSHLYTFHVNLFITTSFSYLYFAYYLVIIYRKLCSD